MSDSVNCVREKRMVESWVFAGIIFVCEKFLTMSAFTAGHCKLDIRHSLVTFSLLLMNPFFYLQHSLHSTSSQNVFRHKYE